MPNFRVVHSETSVVTFDVERMIGTRRSRRIEGAIFRIDELAEDPVTEECIFEAALEYNGEPLMEDSDAGSVIESEFGNTDPESESDEPIDWNYVTEDEESEYGDDDREPEARSDDDRETENIETIAFDDDDDDLSSLSDWDDSKTDLTPEDQDAIVSSSDEVLKTNDKASPDDSDLMEALRDVNEILRDAEEVLRDATKVMRNAGEESLPDLIEPESSVPNVTDGEEDGTSGERVADQEAKVEAPMNTDDEYPSIHFDDYDNDDDGYISDHLRERREYNSFLDDVREVSKDHPDQTDLEEADKRLSILLDLLDVAERHIKRKNEPMYEPTAPTNTPSRQSSKSKITDDYLDDIFVSADDDIGINKTRLSQKLREKRQTNRMSPYGYVSPKNHEHQPIEEPRVQQYHQQLEALHQLQQQQIRHSYEQMQLEQQRLEQVQLLQQELDHYRTANHELRQQLDLGQLDQLELRQQLNNLQVQLEQMRQVVNIPTYEQQYQQQQHQHQQQQYSYEEPIQQQPPLPPQQQQNNALYSPSGDEGQHLATLDADITALQQKLDILRNIAEQQGYHQLKHEAEGLQSVIIGALRCLYKQPPSATL